jgi:hypothetical protein
VLRKDLLLDQSRGFSQTVSRKIKTIYSSPREGPWNFTIFNYIPPTLSPDKSFITKHRKLSKPSPTTNPTMAKNSNKKGSKAAKPSSNPRDDTDPRVARNPATLRSPPITQNTPSEGTRPETAAPPNLTNEPSPPSTPIRDSSVVLVKIQPRIWHPNSPQPIHSPLYQLTLLLDATLQMVPHLSKLLIQMTIPSIIPLAPELNVL